MATTIEKIARAELVKALVERDGLACQYPECNHDLDLSIIEGPREVTIDHWMPQWWCKDQGWPSDKIWGLDNLKLMCKSANARKGNRIPNPDGTLPPKRTSTFRYRRDKRGQRPEICTSCASGRNLGPDEVCAACGSGPMPDRYPRWAKVSSTECLHDGVFWCWACSIGIVPMRGATEVIMLGGEGGDV